MFWGTSTNNRFYITLSKVLNISYPSPYSLSSPTPFNPSCSIISFPILYYLHSILSFETPPPMALSCFLPSMGTLIETHISKDSRLTYFSQYIETIQRWIVKGFVGEGNWKKEEKKGLSCLISRCWHLCNCVDANNFTLYQVFLLNMGKWLNWEICVYYSLKEMKAHAS